jgi:hypothetical protein
MIRDEFCCSAVASLVPVSEAGLHIFEPVQQHLIPLCNLAKRRGEAENLISIALCSLCEVFLGVKQGGVSHRATEPLTHLKIGMNLDSIR